VNMTLWDCQGVRILECPPTGDLLRDEDDAVKLIGAAFEHGAKRVLVPVGRFGDDFFRLSTRVAGLFIQKFVNYKVGLVIVGDISGYLAESRSLRDFVHECNQGDYLWFVADREELEKRLLSQEL
jgi:hypothetical protein